MTGWYACTGFQRDLLVAIAAHGDAEPYGLALKAWLDDRYADPVNHSRLYQNLDQLDCEGLVTKHALDARTNAYRLTDQGRAAVDEAAATLARVTDRRKVAPDGGGVDP